VGAESKEENWVALVERSLLLLKAALQQDAKVILDTSPFESLFLLCSQDAFCSFSLNEQIKDSRKNTNNECLERKEDEGDPVDSGGISADKAKVNSDRENRISVSDNQLKVFLQISTLVMQTRRNGDDFLSKANGRLDAVLAVCFKYAMQEDGELVRLHLKSFLLAFFSIYDRYPIQIMSEVKSLMGNALTWSAQLMLESIESRKMCASSSPPLITGETAVSTVGRIDFFGLFILQVIDELCKRGKFGILESLTGVLVEVMGFLSHGEVVRVDNQEQSNSKFATPTIGIIQQSNVEKDAFDQRKKESCSLNQYSVCGTAVTACIICVRLLAESSVPYTFSLKRKAFFSILGTILDSSNNIIILTSCVVVIHSWVTDKCGCPMTSKEIASFIGKMTSLDSHCLSDSAAQPLYELVANTISFLCRWQKSSLKTVSFVSSGDEDVQSSLAGHENLSAAIKKEEIDLSQKYLMSRALVATLMCANADVRYSALLTFGMHRRLDFDGAQNGYNSEHISRFGCISGRSPSDILWQLFSSDLEGVGSRYWISVFTDILIAISDHSGNLQLVNCSTSDSTNPMREHVAEEKSAPSSKKTNSGEDSSNSSYPCAAVTSLDSQFKDYEAFVAAGSGQGRCLSALRVLAYSDVSLCYTLFRSLMCSAFAQFRNADTECYLAPKMEQLLSHPCHSQFLKVGKFLTSDDGTRSRSSYHTNCVKAFLGVVVCLRPVPYLNPDLLLSIATHYNAWHEVIFLFENYITISGTHTEKFKMKLQSSLQICYGSLGEDDLRSNVAMKSAYHSSTVRACTLEMYGRIDAAVALYEALFQREGESSTLSMPSRELSLWEERWIELNRELCRWDVLKDFGNAKNLESLIMECSWKSRDWETLRRLCVNPSNVAYLELGEPLLKIYELYLSMAEEKVDLVESLYFQAGQLCLYKWQLLPNGASSCGAKKLLLQYFHRLVELLESSKMLHESQAYTKKGSLPDFKNQLNAWRERIPNQYDSLKVWEDLFTWRSHLYSVISSKFQWSDDGSLAEIHDRPWTSIQIARVARKQGKKDVALMSLSKLTDCAMDVNDAFSKLREQIMLYLHSKRSDELCGGLNLVNTTNLSFFDQAQKSEIFRLKASFLNSLGAKAKANQVSIIKKNFFLK
jgi:transformation/transcription domain-associated protein